MRLRKFNESIVDHIEYEIEIISDFIDDSESKGFRHFISMDIFNNQGYKVNIGTLNSLNDLRDHIRRYPSEVYMVRYRISITQSVGNIDIDSANNKYKSVCGEIESLTKRISSYSNVEIKSYKRGITMIDDMTTRNNGDRVLDQKIDIKLIIQFSTSKR